MIRQQSINASVHLQLWDMVRAFIAVGLRRFRWGMVGLGIVLVFVAIQFCRIEPWYNPDSAAVGLTLPQNLLLLGLLASLFPIYFFTASYFVARSSLKNNSTLRGVIQYSFSEEGIRHQGTHSEGSLGWGGLNRVGETRGAFLLFHDKFHAQIIPKRSFASESDVVAFRELLKRQFPTANLRS
jgi:hypothetical protein